MEHHSVVTPLHHAEILDFTQRIWALFFLLKCILALFPLFCVSLRLTDGCSSHMTAVAVGALGGYLNYYLAEQDITKRPLS